MGRPRYPMARAFKWAQRTAGDININSTSWAVVDSALDLTIAAEAGDQLGVGVSLRWAAANYDGRLRPVSLVGATVRQLAGGTSGVSGWYGDNNNAPSVHGPVALCLVTAPDLVAGYITVRLEVAQGVAGTKTLNASAALPLVFYVMNFGPADPN